MYQRIGMEMMSGKGPDLIFTDRTYSMKNDFYKMSQNGSFADMDVLAGNSETFKFNEYNEVAIDAGIIDGTRVLIPYSYYVPYGFTTEEVLENNGIELPDVMTYEELKELYAQYHENNEPRYDAIVELMFIDIFSPNPTIDIDSDILRYFLEKRKELYDKEVNIKYSYNFDNTANGEYILCLVPFSYVGNELGFMASEYNTTNNISENNIKFVKMPCDSDGNSKAYVDKGVAINSNSKHKNYAFKFVEYLMSCKFSADVDYNDVHRLDLPVYKNAYEGFIRYFRTTAINGASCTNDKISKVIPEHLANDCIDIIESPTSCVFGGQGIYILCNIVSDLLQDYYDGKISYDELIASIKNKYDLYKSE